MKLVIGLGNLGDEYDKTRHNIGFMILDAFVQNHNIEFIKKDKFKSYVTETTIGNEKILLIKPTTFYNHSGEAYRLIADFYKIPSEDILIVHDDLALPFGTIRSRVGGSDAGNNGIKSINQHGGGQTSRLRIGIANEQREVIGDTDFVLGKFSTDEMMTFNNNIQPAAITLINNFINDQFIITSQHS